MLDPLLPAVETAYTYDAANRIATFNNVPYTWDANARAASQSTARDNRLTAVSTSGMTIDYTYNGLGDRLSQFKSGVTTHNVGLVLFGRSRI